MEENLTSLTKIFPVLSIVSNQLLTFYLFTFLYIFSLFCLIHAFFTPFSSQPFFLFLAIYVTLFLAPFIPLPIHLFSPPFLYFSSHSFDFLCPFFTLSSLLCYSTSLFLFFILFCWLFLCLFASFLPFINPSFPFMSLFISYVSKILY